MQLPYKYEIRHNHTAYFQHGKDAQNWVAAMSIRNPQYFNTNDGVEVRWITLETTYNHGKSRASAK